MANPDEKPTSHGQTGDSPATPVPDYKSYGGRDEVAGGPAGRGNDTGSTVGTGKTWSRGVEAEGTDEQPVKKKPDDPNNPFAG